MAASKKALAQAARCGQFWAIIDEGRGVAFGGWPCFSWRCPVCGPKREAEAMAMLRFRLDAWQADPEAAPNFITLTCDPSALPGWITQGSDEEDGYLRDCFQAVMRQLNQTERRHGQSRIQYVAVVERGGRTNNWHIHVVTDREIHVNRWRKSCVARGLGRVVKGKRLKGAKGAAVYLAKYMRKGGQLPGKKRRVLMHSRGCLPSLELWRWRRRIDEAYRDASEWTTEQLKRESARMRLAKAKSRAAMEAEAEGPLRVRGTALRADGSRQVLVSRRLKPKYASPIPRPRAGQAKSSRAPRKGQQLLPTTEHESPSEPS